MTEAAGLAAILAHEGADLTDVLIVLEQTNFVFWQHATEEDGFAKHRL
jgi:hypothetical protein